MSRIYTWNTIPAHEKRLTVATMVTLMRIILIPFIIAAMCMHAWMSAFVLFMAAACTDLVDGAIARARHEQTVLGECLDPIADKCLLISCFITLAYIQAPFFSLPLWFVLLVLSKELLMIGGTYMLYARNKEVAIQPTRLGKTVTFLQISFIAWLFVGYFFSWQSDAFSENALVILASLVIATLVQYGRIGFGMWRSI